MTPPIFLDHFDRSLPALKLGGVQFTQMQHLPRSPKQSLARSSSQWKNTLERRGDSKTHWSKTIQ